MRSRLLPLDALVTGICALRARRLRSLLSLLGVSVAIAALVAVLGIAASAKADLLAQLGAQGNLLTVASGQTFTGSPSPLPLTAERMIRAIPPVQDVTAVANVSGATARRSAAVPPLDTSGITVMAVEPSLPRALSATTVLGHYLGPVGDRYPEVVLGYQAAQDLGIAHLDAATQVFIGGRYFVVTGVLAPVEVAPEIDAAALVSFPVATSRLGLATGPTRIYVRAVPDEVVDLAAVLPFTASPQNPEAVEVRRPSDVLKARIAAKTAFVGLFLALGAVALLVGGVGIANIMVISVLERRSEIGLRRALGARAGHVAAQFLLESAALTTAGGAVGVGLGVLVTAAAAHLGHQTLTIPLLVPVSGLAAALGVGLVAGLYPALRAARLLPAEALRAG